jgi:hypothetical protein
MGASPSVLGLHGKSREFLISGPADSGAGVQVQVWQRASHVGMSYRSAM